MLFRSEKQYRRQGIFKILLDELFVLYPNKEICCAVANKKIIPFLKNLGFNETKDSLPNWGRPSNCLILKMSL